MNGYFWFHNIFIPSLWRVIRNSEGEGGSQKAKFLKESMMVNWNFPRVEGWKVHLKVGEVGRERCPVALFKQ